MDSKIYCIGITSFIHIDSWGGKWFGLVTKTICGHVTCGEMLGPRLGICLVPEKPCGSQ